jgi:hypothetical protein
MISWKVIALIYAMCIFWIGYESNITQTKDKNGNVIKNKKNK